jgi:tetratricopeptide (TPR) repeat protein
MRRLQEKGRKVHLLGFTKHTPSNLKQLADSFIVLDALLKQFHSEDIASIVDTFVSLSRKLPYVGYKYLMDILSRNNLHTDYRQLLNDAQEEGIIRLVEVDDPNTVRGKAFAVKLVPEHPAITKYLQEMGLTADSLSTPVSVQIHENNDLETGGSFTSEDHGDSRFVAGKRLVEIGQHEAAISEFFNYLEDYPNDFLGYVYVINCLIKNGDRKQARAWCKKALNLPNSANNQKEYPRWFTYMKRISTAEIEPLLDEEEKIELSG